MGLIAAGVVIVALLIGAFWMGARIRRREPAPPRPDEQPKMPEGVRSVRCWRTANPTRSPAVTTV